MGCFWETLREIKVKGVYSLGASPKVALLVLHRFFRSATRSSAGIATHLYGQDCLIRSFSLTVM